MKTTQTILTLTLALSLCCLSAFAGPAQDLKLTASCHLARVTWDDTAQQRVVQHLAPESVQNVVVPIQELTSGHMDMKILSFFVQTPEGEMEFDARISALDMFGKMASLTAIQSITIKEKDLAITDANMGRNDIKYSDANLNPISASGIRFSTGLKDDGTVSVVYESGCSIKVSKAN